MAIMEGKLELGLGLGVLFVAFILPFFISLLITFTYSFFAYRKIRKVLTGVLPRAEARSPGRESWV